MDIVKKDKVYFIKFLNNLINSLNTIFNSKNLYI